MKNNANESFDLTELTLYAKLTFVVHAMMQEMSLRGDPITYEAIANKIAKRMQLDREVAQNLTWYIVNCIDGIRQQDLANWIETPQPTITDSMNGFRKVCGGTAD